MKKEENKQLEDTIKLAMEQPINQDSDLTGVMKTLNDDAVDKDGLSKIDMKTRLHPFELTSMVIHDAVIGLQCLPTECSVTTRSKKRLAVSLKGLGREEIVRIVQGEREKQEGFGFGEKMKNLFVGGDK